MSRIDSDTDSISADNYDLLVVVHPKNLGDRALWAIDEWVQRGEAIGSPFSYLFSPTMDLFRRESRVI